MENLNPLITIIIPVYNGSRFIETTLKSVKNQVYDNWECIIIDDGSKDNSEYLIRLFIEEDSRFKYFYQNNKGLAGARNSGLSMAKGLFIQFLDADDVILPLKIEKQVEQFVSLNIAPKNYISFTDYSYGSNENIYNALKNYMPVQFHSQNYFEELVERWESSLIIPCHCFLFSSDLFFVNKLKFDSTLPNHEDFDCWVSLFHLRPLVNYVDEKLCLYRVSDTSMSRNGKLMGEGFIQVLTKGIDSEKFNKKERKLLLKKRLQTLGRYNRFDLMTTKDKLLSIKVIALYYSKRIFQKLGILH